MTEDDNKLTQDLYDTFARQYCEACQDRAYPEIKCWQRDLLRMMRLLDLRLKNLGEE